jgi:hypothetical protein
VNLPIQPGQLLIGSLFNEPMRVETVASNGPESWVVGLVGLQSERFRKVTLTAKNLASLTIQHTTKSYDGDGQLLRLGFQAYALGIAYEFDPYFGLSISRVDPLPHQLEAVYDYLLKVARVRFLLADDAGAGKTIMAGLLIPGTQAPRPRRANPHRLPIESYLSARRCPARLEAGALGTCYCRRSPPHVRLRSRA